jgi:hypothetical protein
MPVEVKRSEGRDYEVTVYEVFDRKIKASLKGGFDKGLSSNLRCFRAKFESLKLIEESKRLNLKDLKDEIVIKTNATEAISYTVATIKNKVL